MDDDTVTGVVAKDEEEAFSGLAIPSKGSLLLGKYRVEGVIGVGGMGMVIAAKHEHLNERVALKMLLPQVASVAVTRKRFQREAQASYKLRSEHVCRILDAGELEDGTPFIAMEFLKGEDVAAILRKKHRLPIAEAVDYILQACEALGEAHANGIIHRDLKPSNLVVVPRKDGTRCLKVIDFGISKVSNESSSLTDTFGYLGSPSYSAPEQFASTRAVTASGDIWSLGVILYEMVLGELPFVFHGSTIAELATTITREAPVPMLRRDPSIDPAFAQVVLGCLEKDPANRHLRVRELAEALAPFAGSAPDELVTRIRRHQPGELLARAELRPKGAAELPPVHARTATLAMKGPPPPSAIGSSPNVNAAPNPAPSQPSLPPPPLAQSLFVPPVETRHAIAAEPRERTSHRSVWVLLALVAVAGVAVVVAVAVHRGARPAERRDDGATAAAAVTPSASVEVTPAVPSATGSAVVHQAASAEPSAPVAPIASTTKTAATPVTRATATGRTGPAHRVPAPAPASAEPGPKILRDREGKF